MHRYAINIDGQPSKLKVLDERSLDSHSRAPSVCDLRGCWLLGSCSGPGSPPGHRHHAWSPQILRSSPTHAVYMSNPVHTLADTNDTTFAGHHKFRCAKSLSRHKCCKLLRVIASHLINGVQQQCSCEHSSLLGY